MSKYQPQAPLPSSVTQADLQTAADGLATYLRANCSQEDIDTAIAEFAIPEWPTQYRNRQTERVYQPHGAHEALALLDTPRHILIKGGEGSGKSVCGIVKTLDRLKRGLSGIMACVAADTLIDGIPIAERTHPAPVNTLLGPTLASPSFCEGRADLFRVATESGDWVVVTANHRFLTPLGWRPLQDLRVGDVIAVDDSEHGRNWREISPGSLLVHQNVSLNMKWGRLSSITFQRYGDFYDLTVPSVGHYSAGGLFHHNSPDLPHFKRSLWPEFQRWCPWEQVIEKHRNRGHIGWEPYQPFYLVFQNDAILFCGGMDEPGAWEGPNVNFAFFDEARRKKKSDALKVLTGRIRIPGPDNTPPQIWITTTPRKHWLYEFFGGLSMMCQDCQSTNLISIQEGKEMRCRECGSTNLVADDPYEKFKRESRVVTLLTTDNEPNLQEDFAAQRAQTLTAKEARVLLEAAWEDFEEGQPFLPSMTWWESCRESLPSLGNREPMVVGMDAAIGRTSGVSDCFAIVGVTRHPDTTHHPNSVAVRYVKSWQARSGGEIDFQGTDSTPGPERELRHLCANYNVKVVVYDPYQLHDMATRLSRERIVWMKPFGQTGLRSKSDSDLLRLILEKRVAHNGDSLLTRHIANADRKVDPEGRQLKLVKREDTGKIDLAVALSMASYEALRLNL